MVQRRAARYVLNRYNYVSSVNEMLQELQWNTLEEKRKKDRLVLFYKIHNDQTGIDTAKYLKPLGRVSLTSTTKLMRSHSLLLIIINSPTFQEQ